MHDINIEYERNLASEWMHSMSWNLKILAILLAMFCQCSLAVSILPGSVEPGRVQQNYLPQKPLGVQAAPSIAHPPEKATNLGPAAVKIKFKLTQIVLEGNYVYSTKELSLLYQDKLNTVISVAELENIVQNITNFYRNNGYILSRAILPPQHVKNGVVRIRILEGYINKVNIIGNPKGARRMMADYGNRISASRPLQLHTMEYYLLLANQTPGTSAKAILEPSKTKTAASDLNLVVDQQIANFSISYDNYGTLYIGPHQITAIGSLNSVVRSGDMIRATYLAATRAAELHYLDIDYQTPLGDHGLTFTMGGNQSLTAPGFVLEPLDTDGKANIYYLSLQYPLLLSRSGYLLLDGGFNYIDSGVNSLGNLLYLDHIRPIHFGATYAFADGLNGSNVLSGHIEQGLDVMGASDNPLSLTSSHFGADGIFIKGTLQLSHLQPIRDTPFSLYLLGQGQYSNKPLLASEQFGFGGSFVGRGYDPAEFLGDNGAAGSVELRLDTHPEKLFLSTVEFYIFYDIGKIWDIQELPGIPQEQSGTSTGIGSRFYFNKFVSGNVMFTQVITTPIASEALIHRGKNPKTFFSLMATL